MMNFCKKSVHSFLGLNTIKHPARTPTTTHHDPPPPPPHNKCGLGLIMSSSLHDPEPSPNILECSSLLKHMAMSPPPSLPPPTPASSSKKDPGRVGFIDEIGGEVDGLMSCTESLGFESCDERRVDFVDDDDQNFMNSRCSGSSAFSVTCSLSKKRNVKEVKSYPPPLSSFDHNGQLSFFLRPVRKDGRLELTEVRIDRPEILRASRQDGRLRLHLIENDEDEGTLQNQEQHEDEGQKYQIDNHHDIEVEEEEERKWRFPVSKSEGLIRRRSCHELVMSQNQNHHNRFITII